MQADREQDDEEDWEDDDSYDSHDGDDSDDEPTIPCPYCRNEILEDSPWCPSCDRYISAEDHAGPRQPLWVILTALICLGVTLWWVFAAFAGRVEGMGPIEPNQINGLSFMLSDKKAGPSPPALDARCDA